MKKSHIVGITAAVSFLFGALGIGIAQAVIPDADGTIHACVKNVGGNVRIIDGAAKCNAGETAMTWNQKGQPGADGINGVSGLTYTSGTVGGGAGSQAGASQVPCENGQHVIGGGVHLIDVDNPVANHAEWVVTQSYPTADGKAWRAAWNIDNPQDIRFRVEITAICA